MPTWTAHEAARKAWDPCYVSPLWAGTGLHEAAATGNVDALRAQWDRLLAADGDDEHPEAALDSTAPDGRVWADSVLHSSLRRTPLMLAALGGHERMVAALLAMGVDATLADAIGRTALQLAASEAVRKLLACVAPVAERLALNDQLLSAAKAKDTDGVAAALAAGAFQRRGMQRKVCVHAACVPSIARVTLAIWTWCLRCWRTARTLRWRAAFTATHRYCTRAGKGAWISLPHCCAQERTSSARAESAAAAAP